VPATDAAAMDLWIRLEEESTRVALPVLEDLIRRVASMCGRKIRRETDAVLTRQFEIPKSTEKLLSQLLSQFAKNETSGDSFGRPIRKGLNPSLQIRQNDICCEAFGLIAPLLFVPQLHDVDHLAEIRGKLFLFTQPILGRDHYVC
jgi:hypothetical protein